MSDKSAGIPCRLNIDPSALAALSPSTTSPALADLLRDVKQLLAECRDRLASGGKLLLNRREAAERLGISARTLQDLPIPSVLIGTARRWHVDDLAKFCSQNKAIHEPVRKGGRE